MRYTITLANYVITGDPNIGISLGPIPCTPMREITLDTDAELGMEIWHGYLEMRETQKSHRSQHDNHWRGNLTEKAPEIEEFRKAVNMFFRYLAGEGCDTCERVFKIVCIDHPIVEVRSTGASDRKDEGREKSATEFSEMCGVNNPER